MGLEVEPPPLFLGEERGENVNDHRNSEFPVQNISRTECLRSLSGYIVLRKEDDIDPVLVGRNKPKVSLNL